MGRNARIKKTRREAKRLLAAHPEQRCGYVRPNEDAPWVEPKRCDEPGRWKVRTEEGQRTYDAETKEVVDTPGVLYACHAHVIGFKLHGNLVERIA